MARHRQDRRLLHLPPARQQGDAHDSHGARHFESSAAAWERRIQSGQASAIMVSAHRPARHAARAGAVRRLDRPHRRRASCPRRSRRGRKASSATSSSPIWDWADPKGLSARRDLDRQAQSDASTPTASSTARPKRARDFLPVLDPVHNTDELRSRCRCAIRTRRLPRTIQASRPRPIGARNDLGQPDQRPQPDVRRERPGLVHRSRSRPAADPAFCKAGFQTSVGEAVPAAKFRAPAAAMYDPKTRKFTLDRHLLQHPPSAVRRRTPTTRCGSAAAAAAKSSAGSNTKMFDADRRRSRNRRAGRALVLDTNGNGKRDAYVEPDQPRRSRPRTSAS